MSLDLAALDVTLQAAGLDQVLAAFQAVDEAGAATAAKDAGTIPFTTPGASETMSAIQAASVLLGKLEIDAKAAAGGIQAVIVSDRDLANANTILAKSGLEVEAVSKQEAAALAEQAAAAQRAAVAMREAAASGRGGGGGVVLPPGGVGGAGGEAEEAGAVEETTAAYAGLTGTLLELIAVYETYRAVRDAVVAGGEFDASIESARLGIAAITQAYGTLTDSQGNVLTGQQALAAAFSIADVQLQALQADAVRVAIPFQTLADLFRGIEGAALKTGASLDQIRQLVTSASLAATALGTPYEQLNTTLVQLLEGHVRVTNQLVAHLGLSNQIVHEWQAQGTLIPNLLATFEKFNVVGEQVQGTWRGISAEIKNAFDIFTGTAIRPALTTLEQGLRDVLGEVIDTSTGKVNEAFAGLEQYVGAGFNLIARGIVEGLKAAVDMAKEFSGWLDKNRGTMLNLVSGAAALVEGIGTVVKEAISIVAPLEAAYLTSGLVLIPIKMVGELLAGAVDGVHLLEAAISGVGFLVMNVIVTPFALFNEMLGKAFNLVHGGLGDGFIEVGQAGETMLQKIVQPALDMVKTIQGGNLEVEKFGRNWNAAQADAAKAAGAIQKAIEDTAKALANFNANPPPGGGDGKDAVANAEAAAQIIGAAVETEKAKLKAALDANQLSYKQYFDALTAIEIAALDAQIRAKQAALTAATKPDERTKIEGEIAKLQEQEQATRIRNEGEYQQKIAETNDKVLKFIAEQQKASGDEFTARLGAIGKEAEAYEQALAREGVADNERRARVQAFVETETEAAEAADLQKTIETQLTQVEQTRALIQAEVKEHLISQVQAAEQLDGLQQHNLSQITDELNELESIAKLLKDPKLMNAVITLRLKLLNEDGKELTDMKQLQLQFAQAVGKAIADGVAQGFAQAFQTGSISKGFQAFADTMLSGFGAAMVQFGQAALLQSTLMLELMHSLATMNPVAGIALSLAMIAAGEALEAAAQAAFGGGAGGAGAPSGAGGAQTINIALPGGVSGGTLPGAQPPATVPGSPPVMLPTGALGSVLPQPQIALPAAGSLASAGPPMNIQIVTLGRWSPDMQLEAMREIRLAMRRGL